jgi:Uma2 family endonuclease
MGIALHKPSLAEFMAWEAEQETRHEFHRGEVFAMMGGRRGHSRIIANLVRTIWATISMARPAKSSAKA